MNTLKSLSPILLVASVLFSCKKDNTTNTNKCLNGGYEEQGVCVCPYGYMGDSCQTSINHKLFGRYLGEFSYEDSTLQAAELVIEAGTNKHPDYIAIYHQKNNHWKDHITDAEVQDNSFLSKMHTDSTYTELAGTIIADRLTIHISQTNLNDNTTTVIEFDGQRQ